MIAGLTAITTQGITGMFRVSLVFPQFPGARFDLMCFCSRHLPGLKRRLGSACRSMVLERGLTWGNEDWAEEDIPTGLPVTLVHFYFDSEASFHQATAPYGTSLLDELPSCTDIEPRVHVARNSE